MLDLMNIPFDSDLKAAWLLQSEYIKKKLGERQVNFIYSAFKLCQNSRLHQNHCVTLLQNKAILHPVRRLWIFPFDTDLKSAWLLVSMYKKVWWIAGQLDLLRLQILPKPIWLELIVQCRYRTEPYSTTLQRMNIPIWYSSQSSLVATVRIYKKVWSIAAQLDLVRRHWVELFVRYRYRTERCCTMLEHMNFYSTSA